MSNEKAKFTTGPDCTHVKHTPGPWFVSDEEQTIVYVKMPNGYEPGICDTAAPSITCLRQDSELIANAHLIAAAPELLDALNACLPFMHDLEHENHEDMSVGIFKDLELSAAFEKMKAALAKATAQ